jgi:hypothetical protein
MLFDLKLLIFLHVDSNGFIYEINVNVSRVTIFLCGDFSSPFHARKLVLCWIDFLMIKR